MLSVHPLAYLITFRTYGTWLHGDERRSVDRRHNAWHSRDIGPQPSLEHRRRSLLKCEPVILSPAAREVVDRTIRDVCTHRGWPIRAVNVRTNHVHIVVAGAVTPEKIMGDLKKWATRRLRETGHTPPDAPVWSEHGSTRYIWDDAGYHEACAYVVAQ
jgi:REP element-mobilizing transposase RayT